MLHAAAAIAAIVAGSATSCARAANDETAVINAIDQAVRTGEFGRAAAVLQKLAESGNREAKCGAGLKNEERGFHCGGF